MIALLVLITVLVVLTLYWAKRSRICKKNQTLTQVEIESADISQDHLDVSSGYDDILSVSEVMRKKRASDEESNNVKLNEDIPTSCNEAYGVAGVCKTQNINTVENTEQSECVYAIIDDSSPHESNNTLNGFGSRQEDNRSHTNTKDYTPDYENIAPINDHSAEGDDDEPDYENLVSPDHVLGDYAVPEFDLTSSSAKVQNSFNIVEYSKLRGYPESGSRMKSSRSMPHILEEVKPIQNKQNKGCKKSHSFKITDPMHS